MARPETIGRRKMTALVKKEVVRFSIACSVTMVLLYCSGVGGYGPCGPGSLIGAICFYTALPLLLLDLIFFGFIINAVIRRKEPIQSPQTTTGSSAPDRV